MTDLYIFNREISIVELDKDVSKYYFSSDWLLNMEIQKSSVFFTYWSLDIVKRTLLSVVAKTTFQPEGLAGIPVSF